MSEAPERIPLKPCPCGKVPTNLFLEGDHMQKYRNATCDCGDWSVEYRNDYADGDKARIKAERAWNEARRADLARLPEELASRLAEMLQACWPDRAKHEAPMESLLRDILAWHEGGQP
jgi:hypothetical protein